MKRPTKYLVRTATISAIYATLTLAVYPLSYGAVQIRVSEALTILPLFFPEAVVGLAVGCFLANIPMGIWDMLIGTTATLIASIFTRLSRHIYLGVIPPIVANALLVPLIFLTMPDITTAYYVNVLTVGLGELLSVVGLGVPLYFALLRLKKAKPSLMD